MVALGMTPMEAIVASTATAARLIGVQNIVGTLTRGKEADLVILRGNPLQRIDLLRDRTKILGVMRGGRRPVRDSCPARFPTPNAVHKKALRPTPRLERALSQNSLPVET